MATAPRVFVSHASEDKQRFVVRFAERLRANGVDAWLDQWEMKPGDSLVDRIFEQGLKPADAVVIVISAVSVTKPWVRQELNTSVVARISRGLKIVPVVIDKCEIPECLASTLWQRIDDVEHYDDAFQRILDAIFDRSSKPPLGQPPERLTDVEPKLPALTAGDQQALKTIYDQCMTDGVAFFAQASDDVRDSVEILRKQGYLNVDQFGMGELQMTLTTEGFQKYAEACVPGYKETLAQLGALIVNEEVVENTELAKRLAQPQQFVNALLDVLAEAGHLVLSKYGGGLWEIARVSPTLKRSLA
jgi:TIR domain-containing protein